MRTCPFDAADNTFEIRRAFWSGRMDMLFELVANGKLSVDEAADIAEMSLLEAEEMLHGWREAQEL